MTKRFRHSPILALITVILLQFGGCATVNLDEHMAETPEQALSLATAESDPETGQRYLLRVASQFQDQERHQAARTLLKPPLLDDAPEEIARQQRLLAMASANALSDADWAEQLLAGRAPESFLAYPAELMTRAALLQAQTYKLAGKPLDGALTLILLGQTDSSTSPQEIHNRIWQLLKTIRGPELRNASDNALGFETQGWLELALRLRTRTASLDDQGRLIRQWQNNWPGHPAAQILPADLALLAELAASRPEKLVLAVPLQGALASAGKAIRDGFLAAYYQDETTDRSKTDIRVVDTSTGPFPELYRKLSNTDLDLIVGPLDKEKLAQLASMNTLAVPLLGLNYLNPETRIPDGLYQFGLSAEDEARQIANRLHADNIQRVLALIPFGEWGDRVEASLQERMTELGLTTLSVERFFPEDNLRSVTANLLGISVSRQRAIQVERTIGMNVEFEPRRRQDAEAIVLVAAPTIARQFKPLFAFYYGGDLPVYSPSIVYEGTPNPGRDRDINQIFFTDIPWVLAESNPLREASRQYLRGTTGQLGRLFAMGADAWQLSKRLPLLRQVPDAAINGQTGRLTMAADGSIHREQLWAQFRNGTPNLLKAPTASEQREPEPELESTDENR
ncbi:penicillin-binding protein activator [Marinobacter sp. VGCF2001]|uniref:penicillin-binding protein activator n=1 Tax=Marinobacter sp. VGCF2001 TaxID=3417189 RepID=UPI003CEF9C46